MQSRRLFVSGIAFTGLAGCAGAGGSSLASLSGLRKTECNIIQTNGHVVPECGGGLGIIAATAVKSTNYTGVLLKTPSGKSFPAIDGYGATSNAQLSPGKAITYDGYALSATTITPSHPLFSGQPYSIGPVKVTPKPQFGMTRFTSTTYGSGAMWIASTASTTTAYMVYSGFPAGATIQIAQGPGPGTMPPPTCEQQNADMGIIGILFGIVSGGAGAAIEGAIGATIGAWAAALGAPFAASAMTPCPPSTPNIINGLSGAPEAVSGIAPPDGGGTGGSGPDQLLYA